ncbi:CsbD family protein [Novosphingobium sp. KACC 22771]|uniref:CsbD family protein n=1 Tax=Novosphingobium sp. KACC 22771 TaxID=3025670 RepID=UPI002365DDF2|nr:CsbD family protein [Novosphingobium sp. KACC 22771]WDF72511.1 CsbD family protein [Novosphingobium sp. KACC 22771]
MRDYINRAKGLVNETAGKAKVKLGKAVESSDLILDGTALQAKGKAQSREASFNDAADDAVAEGKAMKEAFEKAAHDKTLKG